MEPDRLALLEPRPLELSHHSSGRTLTVGGFRMVDEDRLRQLARPGLVRLHDSGYLGWAHTHLVSLHHAERLMGELVEG